jgi:hypothetical protein
MGGQKQGNDPGELVSFGNLTSSANVALPPVTQGNPNSQVRGCTTDFRLRVVTDVGLGSPSYKLGSGGFGESPWLAMKRGFQWHKATGELLQILQVFKFELPDGIFEATRPLRTHGRATRNSVQVLLNRG